LTPFLPVYSDLIGIPWKKGGRDKTGFDCYGLAMEMFRRAGKDLPEYAYDEIDPERIDADFRAHGFARLSRPEPFCLVSFTSVPPFASHMGVVLEDRKRFIHVRRDSHGRPLRSCIERLDHPVWSRKIAGYWDTAPKEVTSYELRVTSCNAEQPAVAGRNPELVTIILVHDPLDRSQRSRFEVEYIPGTTLADYRVVYAPDGVRFAASINGRRIPGEAWDGTHLAPGAQVLLVPLVEDQSTAGILTMLAVFAEMIIPGAQFLIPYTVALGTLASYLLAPKITTPGEAVAPSVYGFSPQTVQQQGLPVPRWYGRIKVYGNIIAANTQAYGDAEGDKQILNVLIDLGTGPVQSITAPMINDQDATALLGVSIEYRLGAMRQAAISNFNNTAVEYSMSVEVRNGTGQYIYETPDDDYDALEIDITFPTGLWGANDDGYFPLGMCYEVEVYKAGDAEYQLVAIASFANCRTSAIRHTVYCTVTSRGTHYVRITKQVADLVDEGVWQYGQDVYLTSVREVYFDDFTYPRHALVGIRAIATSQISGSVRASFILEGLLCRVYDSEAETWSVAYTTNPAWVAFDILTQPVYDNSYNVLRYDCKDPSQLDLSSFAECAAYCNEACPDGAGGTEARITYNGGFDRETNPFDAANHVLSLARSFLVWNGVKFKVVTDKAITGAAEQMFTRADMKPGSFKKTWLPLADRASKVEGVNFKDAANDYAQQTISDFNPRLASKTNTATVDLAGVTKYSEGWRIVSYQLACNEYLLRQYEFQVDAEAVVAAIGDVIDIQDDSGLFGTAGKLVAATASTVTLDTPVTIDESGDTYKIAVRHSDTGIIERKTVTSSAGAHTILSIAPATFSAVPDPLDVWGFGKASVYLRQARIADKSTVPDQETTIRAIDYNASIYNVDTLTPVIPDNTIPTADLLPPVTGLTLQEIYITNQDGSIYDYLDVYWYLPNSFYYAGAEVWLKVAASGAAATPWQLAAYAKGPGSSARIRADAPGDYTIAVATVNVAGQKSAPGDAPSDTITVTGKQTHPADVAWLSAAQNAYFVAFSWPEIAGTNSFSYEIRFGPVGSSWADATPLTVSAKGTHLVSAKVGTGTWTFFLCARDSFGNYSATPATCDLTLSTVDVTLASVASEKALLWPGTLTGFVRHEVSRKLVPCSQGVAADDDWDTFDLAVPNPVAIATYETDPLAWTWIVRCRPYVDITSSLLPGATGVANPLSQMKFDIGGSWTSAWSDWSVGEVSADAVKFKITVDTSLGVASLDDLASTVGAQSRMEVGINVAVASGGEDITYANPFNNYPALQITPVGATLRTFTIVSQTQTAFRAELFDSAGATAAGAINWEAKGV
jgi:predicted phage tail protein